MRKYVAAVAVVFVLLLTGCMEMLHPLYTKDDLTFDPALVGVWEPRDPDDGSLLEFRKKGDKAYTLIITDEDENDKPGLWEARLLELEGHRFMNLNHPKIGFVLLKVESIKPRLKLVFMSDGWLSRHLEDHPGALKHKVENDVVVVTASTEELQKFVLKHVDNEAAWTATQEFLRVKKDKSHVSTRRSP